MSTTSQEDSLEAIGHDVPRQVRRLVRRARKSLVGAAAPFGEDLHQTRTALKRARALLELIPGAKKMRSRVGDVSREVGRLRDAGVAVATFDRVVQSARLRVTPSLRLVRETLERRRTELEAAAGTEAELERAQRTLKREARRIAQGALEEPSWREVKQGYKASYRAARKEMGTAYRRGTDEAFHDLRKAVKLHAYQLKGLQLTTSAGEPGSRQNDLERLGDVLGEAQDLAMFEATLSAERACFGGKDDCRRLLQTMRRRRADLRKQARPLAKSLFRERPAQWSRQLSVRAA